MADLDHIARTTAYFDGALPEAEHAEVLAHLETCAACQQHLLDASTLDAVVSEAPAAIVTRPRRWPIAAIGAAALAAAAVALWFALPHGATKKPTETVAVLELPKARTTEARFTGERFAVHRPLGQMRGDQAHETISLAGLADLEKRGEVHDLVAALVATGDLPRARTLAASLPAEATSDADRSAVELASGDDEQALRFAYRAIDRDPSVAAGWWNLALAAEHARLWTVSRDAFTKVIERAEPGWADEARTHVTTLEHELARLGPGFNEFVGRGAAMVQGGAPITIDDVRAYSTYARLYLLDALRTGIALDTARPLAAELDRLSGTTTMTAAVDRIAAADPKVRAKFVAAYRAVVARTATPAEITALLGKLAAAGHAVDDIRVGTIVQSGEVAKRLDELAALIGPWHDPWFDLYLTRERIRALWAADDARAEAPLTEALTGCANDAWALRCGTLAYDLAERDVVRGLDQEAEHWATFALARQLVAASPALASTRSLLADIHRHLGRTALARAEFSEVVLTDPSCDRRRFAQIGIANVALVEDRWPAVREALPTAQAGTDCTEPTDLLGIATSVELARHTHDATDVAHAKEWIEASRPIADGGVAAVGTLRIAAPTDAAARTTVEAWLAAHPATVDPTLAAIRTWATTTLISAAGARGDWKAVLAAANAEHSVAPSTGCAAVASFDDGLLTVMVSTDKTQSGDQRTVPQTAIATSQLFDAVLTTQLAGCTTISVIARPPLHGRSDVLPASLPWAFVGDHAPRPPVAGTARSVDVSDARPPDPSLPRLAPAPAATPFDVALTGAQATPIRVLGALADATYAELHVHGVAAAANDDATYLALSPDQDGQFALRATAVRAAKLSRAPVVVLAACRAAVVAPYLRQRWSLPDAFVAAGASAVVAADIAIPDASARRVFDDLHRRLLGGEAIEHAVAAIRAAATGDTAWASHLMVFR